MSRTFIGWFRFTHFVNNSTSLLNSDAFIRTLRRSFVEIAGERLLLFYFCRSVPLSMISTQIFAAECFSVYMLFHFQYPPKSGFFNCSILYISEFCSSFGCDFANGGHNVRQCNERRLRRRATRSRDFHFKSCIDAAAMTTCNQLK